MTNEEELNQRKYRNKIVFSFVLMMVNLIIILYLYYLLTTVGVNFIIIFLIIFFAILMFIGPVVRGKRKTLYAKMFPEKRPGRSQRHPTMEEFKVEKPKEVKNVNLDFKYQEPLIRKCKKCKMIVPKFTKKCPLCGEIIKD